ncbi:unknown protein [Rivularia sp. IAM M-261]|nr:unknown protein [Rivularia sp. IAM M-261]
MVKLLQATCNNGELILNEKLSSELEGKSLQIMIIDSNESNQDTSSNESKLKKFMERVNNYSFQLPDNYKFNRDDYINLSVTN